MLGTKILLYSTLVLGGALLLLGSAEAKAAPAPKAPRKLPESKPDANTLPRRGPNGTVLLADLPADCKGYYDVAFGQGGFGACGDAIAWSEEIDVQYQQYLDGNPFFDIERYDEAVRAYERAAAACRMAEASEAAAITAWVECLEGIGLTPQQVWAG